MRMIFRRSGEMRREIDDVKMLQQQGRKKERGKNRENDSSDQTCIMGVAHDRREVTTQTVYNKHNNQYKTHGKGKIE